MLTFLSIVLEETNSDTFLFISLTMKIKAAYNLISTHTPLLTLFTQKVGADSSERKIQWSFIKTI